MFLNTPLTIKSLTLPNRLIQGPLAGYSCAPFRKLFSLFKAPAYCVSEMLSAYDVLNKHSANDRYLFRAKEEALLCYQLSGNQPSVMAEAARKLEVLGADIIDVNCGCPKIKIRKKGAGSALLEQPERLTQIITAMRLAINIPLTVKIRLQENNKTTIELAKKIANAGADALIVHGRQWQDSYEIKCNLEQIGLIKQALSIPVIANGDLENKQTVLKALSETNCDAFMISRAGCGKPWLFQDILNDAPSKLDKTHLIDLFVQHLNDLAHLENEYKAVLQSRSLVRYYFRHLLSMPVLNSFYELTTLTDIELFLKKQAVNR